MKNPYEFLEEFGEPDETSKPVDLYANIDHKDLEETERLLEQFNAQILDEMDQMDEVSIL